LNGSNNAEDRKALPNSYVDKRHSDKAKEHGPINGDRHSANADTNIYIQNSRKPVNRADPRRKDLRKNYSDVEDEEDDPMTEIEICHAASIFIQKHIRGFLVRRR
jgi:hypothetical protein